MRLVMLLSALAPALLWMTYFRERDKFRTDAEDVWSAFLIGAVTVIVVAFAIPLIDAFAGPFTIDGLHAKSAGTAFFGATIPEEAVKLAAVAVLFWRHRIAARPYDFIVYAVAVSAGFSALENMFYVDSPNWETIALFRSVTAVPSHIFTGVIMGACLATAQTTNNRRLFWPLAFLLPVMFHGLYDYLVFLESSIREGKLQDQHDLAVIAYEAFILVVIVEGWIADHCARHVSRGSAATLGAGAVPAKPSWHWMNWPKARQWVWAGTGVLAIFTGFLVLLVITFGPARADATTPNYVIIGMCIFALYHGLAFLAQARRTGR